ncbi:DMT family transporter [Kamptonema animale CS-326]|jgi:drug/metabolite transporter (DMT)-like permease|uniref:DMT family transporter n=1 Tax=Kamptonema animale TaxID=92934 RepID=UPI00232DF9F0|nr:DMT family transporter [Kamptonema animale]MDB9513851.1 DMT family transporter [Kamptonema animale CS-326]
MSTPPESQKELRGFAYGFLGVLIFSLTLPATRIAVSGFDPVFVGLGRAIVAAGLSLILLVITRQTIPPVRFLPKFCIVIAGVVIGFPLLSAIAMRDAPASYGAVITGLLPLSTALCGVWRAGERPSLAFWIFAGLGSALVIGFALLSGRGSIRLVDLALLGAVGAAGLGYAEGAVLSRTFGSWQVICWSLILSAPVLLPIVWQHAPSNFSTVSSGAMLGFLYVSIFSMFFGFFAWYRGLSLGGVARIGQVQLLQPFLTILASAMFLGERLTITTLSFAIGVIICVALGKRTQIIAR